MNLAKRLYELQQIDVDIRTQQTLVDDINEQLGESQELIEAKTTVTENREQLSRIATQRKELEWEVDDLEKSIKQVDQKLYGGSVKGSNAAELFSKPDIDGGLIGGASLDAEDFLKICCAAP